MSTNKLLHSMPPHVLMLQALHHRLPRDHIQYQYIEKKLSNELAGFYGESKLLYPLSKIPIVNVTIPNIRLPLHSGHFQIDFLIITPKFLLILESKYYSDELTFDPTVHQVVQKKEHESRVFDDPVLQVEEQAYQLSVWLERYGFELPIEHYVVMTNQRARLKIDPSNIHHSEKIISLQRIPSLFRELIDKYDHDVLVPTEIKYLSQKIYQNHQAYIPDILERYQINPIDLTPGVFCMQCGKIGMKMKKLRWECDSCSYRNHLAHENSVKDYYLLIDRAISNRAFRIFTGLNSRFTAKDMLKRVSNHIKGSASQAKYQLSYDYRYDFKYLSEINQMNSSKNYER